MIRIKRNWQKNLWWTFSSSLVSCSLNILETLLWHVCVYKRTVYFVVHLYGPVLNVSSVWMFFKAELVHLCAFLRGHNASMCSSRLGQQNASDFPFLKQNLCIFVVLSWGGTLPSVQAGWDSRTYTGLNHVWTSTARRTNYTDSWWFS